MGNLVRSGAVALVFFAASAVAGPVAIHELAWMGTEDSSASEWIELRNATAAPILLDGWYLESADLSFRVDLSGTIGADGFFLLERGDDLAVPCVAADLIYPTGQTLPNAGFVLQLFDAAGALIDEVDDWHEGDTAARATMERVDPSLPGTLPCNWVTASTIYCGGTGIGTPGAESAGGWAAPLIVNEIAWGGTLRAPDDEWVELFNRSSRAVNLAGWRLESFDGPFSASLEGRVEPRGTILVSRDDAWSVPCLRAELGFAGPLPESLSLVAPDGRVSDRVDARHAGEPSAGASMERRDVLASGLDPSNWADGRADYCAGAGLGTPGRPNDARRTDCPVPSAGLSLQAELLFADALASAGPSDQSLGAMASRLLQAIEAASATIDFAIHEARGQDAILQALVAAQSRGVQVRCVIESDAAGVPSGDGQQWIDALGTCVTDSRSSIMHHKLFVFDGSSVWTGSTNLTSTGVGGEYNHNHSILIDSAPVAAAYVREVDEMHRDGLFGTAKADDTEHVFCFDDGTRAEVYFSPSDHALVNAVVPAIRDAEDSIDVAIFFLTTHPVGQALLEAHQRGVRVRVLMDAVGAANPFSAHPVLCDAGIDLRIERFGGKEHQKGAAIDGKRVILGSMNWTDAGDGANDENTLLLDSSALAAQFSADFERNWSVTGPDQRCNNPGAESWASTLSCEDGIDNDFDGFTDAADSGCAPGAENTEEACSNGLDDDGDGFVDGADFGCRPFWPDEADVPSCNDGEDDDGDGFVDGADFDCAFLTAPPELLAAEPFFRRIRHDAAGTLFEWDDLRGRDGVEHFHLRRASDPSSAIGFTRLGAHLADPAYRDADRPGPGGVFHYLVVAVGAIRGECGELRGEVEGASGHHAGRFSP